MAGASGYGDFTRAKRGGGTDPANRFLDHGNYLAYGLAATATWVLGLAGRRRPAGSRGTGAVLGKRLARYGLTLHPDKTRRVDFRKPPRGPGAHFDLLGFRHFWSKSRRGRWVVTRKTAADRMSRALHRIGQWCRTHRHWPLREQQRALPHARRP